MKPIELVANAVLNSTEKGQLVMDMFMGSGSTLLACQQTDRRCLGIELEPKYTDVVRRRYWKYTHDNVEDGWAEGTPVISDKAETNAKQS